MSKTAYNVANMQINSINLTSEVNACRFDSTEKKDYQNYNGKLQKTLKYWSEILNFMLIDTAVIFAPIKIDILDQLELVDVVDKIIDLNLITDLKSICYLPHKSFLYVNFGSVKSAKLFQSTANNIKGRKIFYIQKENIKSPITIMIDRIPPEVLKNSLPDILNKYGSILNFRPTLIKIKDKPAIETAPVYVDIELNDSYTKENFPYYIMIDKIKVFMLVRGRKNICYICESNDHLASECVKKYCEVCKKTSPMSHDCSDSYATKLKTSLYKIGSLIDEKNKDAFPVISKNFEDEFKKFSMENILTSNVSVNNTSNALFAKEGTSNNMMENNVFIKSDTEDQITPFCQLTDTKNKNIIKETKIAKKKNISTPKKNGGPTKKSKRDKDNMDKDFTTKSFVKNLIPKTYIAKMDTEEKSGLKSEADPSDSIDNENFLKDLQ